MNKQNKNNSEEFFRMMFDLGSKEKITTPSYADFIQAISIIFDINKDEKKQTRPREMSESRSILQRQTIHDETIISVLTLCQVEERKQKFLKKCFLKIENILSRLKSTPIFSPKSRLHGDLCFFWLVTLPQTMELLRFCRDVQKIDFAAELLHYLKSLAQQDLPEKACIKMLKDEISELLNGIECSEFKIAIGRIDHRSFPKTKSINTILANLETEISIDLDKENAKDITLKARFKFFAAKFAFRLFKPYSQNKHLVAIPDENTLLEMHQGLRRDYVCNQYFNEYNFEFTHNKHYKSILNLYLNSIEHINCEDLPSEVTSTLGSLISWRNRAFLPAAVIKKFWWDLERNRVDERYIRNFEKAFLFTTSNYQYGQIAAQIASMLLALKIQKVENIPHKSLEPLVMTLMANNPISNEITLFHETPFGPKKGIISDTSDFNIAQAIFNFNSDIRSSALKTDLCNPLTGLNKTLGYIFEKIDQDIFFTPPQPLPNNFLNIKPAKAFTIRLYDALKNINGLLKNFNLIELHRSGSDVICAESSLAGESINRYLRLNNVEKIEILKKIDPEQYSKDYSAMLHATNPQRKQVTYFNKKGYYFCDFLVTLNEGPALKKELPQPLATDRTSLPA
ncbi:hypothetical protein [Craterilacuibacter sp. RT1T]|uniref:hypothetical protein n=1 Tax=Craterilacuibacter sp. RT1T TaxID=2942211 RepID=UPI0020BF73A0|nr:hypothetical protein [Craterilacuibacter sp. RT1T]MCL6264490.1 hypothetical protein [Craterilacuibacter sp. RT1T]